MVDFVDHEQEVFVESQLVHLYFSAIFGLLDHLHLGQTSVFLVDLDY